MFCTFFFLNDIDLHSPASLPKLMLILDPDVLVSLLNIFLQFIFFFFFSSSLRFFDFFVFSFFLFITIRFYKTKDVQIQGLIKQARLIIYFISCSSCHLLIFLPSIQFFCFFFTSKIKFSPVYERRGYIFLKYISVNWV